MHNYASESCLESCDNDMQYNCLYPRMLKEYGRLYRRYDRMMTKRKRLLQLSEPKNCSRKFRSTCRKVAGGKTIPKTEIIRVEQLPPRTRTEQLSYPRVTRLSYLKKSRTFDDFSNERKSSVNRMLRKSLHSLYSRLSNQLPPEPPKEPMYLKPAENSEHMRHLAALAKSKQPKVVEIKPVLATQKKNAKKPIKILRRYKNLAKPKIFEKIKPKEWHLTRQLRTFEPSERLKKIAKPKFSYSIELHHDDNYKNRIHIAALRYKASDRIIELAAPPRYFKKTETRANPFQISRNALRAKSSKRIMDLAEPRDYTETHIRSEPYKVSQNALQAKITKRLQELAKPRSRAV